MTGQEHRRIPLEELAEWPGNPRRGDLDAIAGSLFRFGQVGALVVNAGTITGRGLEVLGGNQTVKAARRIVDGTWLPAPPAAGEVAIGWQRQLAQRRTELAALDCKLVDVDQDTGDALVAALNRAHDLGGYDDTALLQLLAGVADLTGTGYNAGDLAALEAATKPRPQLTDPDDAPALEAGPTITQEGDLWLLGRHRLVIGDGTLSDTVELATGGQEADAFITDPPYGVDYVGKTADALTIEGDDRDDNALAWLLHGLFETGLEWTKEGGPAYVFHADTAGELNRRLFEQAGWSLRQVLVWVKDHFVMGRQDHHWQHEPILYGWRPGTAHAWFGGRALTTLLDYDRDPAELSKAELLEVAEQVWATSTAIRVKRPARSREHPTMKPTALLEELLARSTQPGDLVLDTCAGAGSLAIAAEHAGRRAALVELDPHYGDVICRRWQAHTGDRPTRKGRPVDFTEEPPR